MENKTNDTIENQIQETNKKIARDLLEACFGNDQSSISKIESQLEVIFKDLSGLFQSKIIYCRIF